MLKGWIRKYRAVRGLLVLAAAAAFLGGCVYLFRHNPMVYPIPCMFHALTGLYCPGCGGTRACRLLLSGHIFQSFLYHPGVILAAALYVWFMVSHTIEYLSKGRLRIGLPYTDKFLYLEVAVILFQCLLKNMVKILWGTGIL